MSEPTAGTAFFGVETNFKAKSEEFADFERTVTSMLGSIRDSFSRFGSVTFDPLGKITEKVDQQSGLLQRRLAAAAKDYQEQLRKGFTPPQPFAAKANELVTSGVNQINKTISSQAPKLGDADLADLRRTILTAFAEGGAAAARELQSQLRSAAKGASVDAASLAGSANSLRAGNITNPFLKEVPDSQSAADFVAATKRATQARDDAAKASQGAASADDQAAKASTQKAAQTKAAGAGGGNQPPTPPAPPAAPPPPPQDNPASEDAILQGLAERLREGTARFINSGNAVFDPTGPTADTGEDVVSATSGRPLPAPVADRVRKIVEADIKAIEDQISQGALIALTSRVATQPTSVPDDKRTFLDRRTGTEVDNDELLNRSTQDLTALRRKEAAESEAARVADAEREYARELLALAEDTRAKRRLGIPEANTGVRFGPGGTVLDERRGGTPSVLRLSNGGGVKQLNPETDILAANALRRDAENALRDQITAARDQIRAQREQAAAQRDLARTQRDAAGQANRSGVGNNFVHGLTSGGFGSGGADGLDGIARAAGQTAKYSALYQVLNAVQTALHSTVEGFLDANDSITEYQVATGHADAVNAEFLTGLQSVAEVSGFNVGEALDVASKAVRAFADDTDRSEGSLKRLATGFTTQASQLATLAKTDLTDAAGNLTAVASGFDLPKNGAGFRQVTDAIAGAKLAGGGDETQIFQGLANAAITFKSLGFSLNESATILSKINAQTDESGQLIATRMSRLTNMLNGQAAGNFIQSLNQQLGPGQQVDQTASQRDQIIQLGRAYQNLGEAQRGALVSSLGGTAEERELSVLLQNISQIVDEAGKIQPGAGLKEFQARLDNVRAQFKEVQGFIQTIIVNLTTSGLAAPIIEFVGALKGALSALSDISKFLKVIDDATSATFGGLNIGITSAISNLGALLVAVKALQALRNNGGLRGILAGAEQVVAPGRAVARQQLAGTLPGGGSAGTNGAALADISGRAASAASRAQNAIDLPSAVAADADVRDAGQRVKQAAERLARAEEEQAAVVARQTQERRTIRADLGSNGDPIRDLNRRHEQELADAAQGGIGAQLDLATAQAELARALRIQAAQAEIAAQFDARRTAITGSFERQIGRAQGQGQRAFAAGDTAGLQAANAREIALREEFNVKLGAVEAERLLAEQRAAAAASGGTLARGLDAASLGGVGAAGVARQEGAGALGAARAFSATAISGIGRGVTSLFKFLGPVGIGLTVADFALQVKGASDEISRARTDLRDVNAKFKDNALTPSSLRDFASSEGSAADQLQQASGGFTGTIADAFTGGAGAREAQSAKRFSDALSRAASALAGDEARIRSAQNPQQAAASTLDVSNPDNLKNSFDQLQSAGFNASESMNLLIDRIKQLRFVSGSATLTGTEQAQLSQAAGAQSSQSIGELTATQFNTVSAGKAGAQRVPISPASRLDAGKIQARVAELVQGQLQGGANLGSASGRQQLEDVLVRGYSDLVPDRAQAAQLAQKISQFVYDRANQFATTVNSVADLQNVVSLGLQAADADAQRAQTQAQLKSLQNGTRDNSTATGANTRLNDLLQLRSVARQKIAELNQAGRLGGAEERQQADRDLLALNDKIAEAQVQQTQALIAQVQQQLQDNVLIRRTQQRKARTAAQIKSIGQGFFQGDIKAALATKDIDTIRQVFDLASQQEVDTILKELDTLAATKASAARAAQARARAAAAALAAVNAMPRDVAGGAAEEFDKKAVDQANADANSAARDAQAAQAQAGAARKAASQAYPENVYDTGSDRFGGSDKPKGDSGPTAAQIAAAYAQAKAVRDRNSTEALRAAVQAARADYAAAKDQQSKAQALQQLYQAENALTDGLKAITVARRFVNAFPASAVQSAARSVADARLELSKYARGTLEYYQALASLVQAQRQLAESNQAAYFLKQKLNTDLTDPVAQARLAVRQAGAKLALLRKQGAPADLVDQARLDLRDSQNSAESAAFSQRLQDAQTNDQLGRISHEAYIRYLQNEHNRLTAIRHRTRQQQDELNQVDLALKSATQEMQGQFNLGDIKIPTPYEVRRYIATQAHAASAQATSLATVAGGSGQGGSVSIQIDGADVAFVRRILAEYLGPSVMSTRAVSANRKG